jgi:predicted molibdopterin-dependent oxidoreductase YjgC
VINQERRVLSLQQVLAPQGECRADWEIFSQLMALQGLPCPMDLAAIHGEIDKIIPEFPDLTMGGSMD